MISSGMSLLYSLIVWLILTLTIDVAKPVSRELSVDGDFKAVRSSEDSHLCLL